ncbi:MAG: hypothetical protein U0892_03775 [Pirellulales bacterium]
MSSSNRRFAIIIVNCPLYPSAAFTADYDANRHFHQNPDSQSVEALHFHVCEIRSHTLDELNTLSRREQAPFLRIHPNADDRAIEQPQKLVE